MYLWITKLGGPVKGLRPSDKLRPETEPAHEWLLIDPASRRLALSKHNDEAKMLARTLCFDPRRTEKKYRQIKYLVKTKQKKSINCKIDI